MKMSAAKGIAALAKEPLTNDLKVLFGDISYGREYIIPTPFDKRLMTVVSAAVAQGAVESGVARITEFDVEAYKEKLSTLI